MRTISYIAVSLLLLLLSVAATTRPTTQPLSEDAKIRALIDHVRSLGEGVVFIRNDQEHTPAEAADHMQRKRNAAGERIKTASDFITHCASESSVTGKPYRIRFPDKTEVMSGAYLIQQLERLEAEANQ